MQDLSTFFTKQLECLFMAIRIDPQIKNKLNPYSLEINHWVECLLEKFNAFAISVPKRKRKLGDIRLNTSIYRISLNNDLDSQQTLLVLLHELAHAAAFRQYGLKISAHGMEWKKQYLDFLKHLKHLLGTEANEFPFPDKIKATTTAAIPRGLIPLKELPQGQIFQIGQRLFIKGELRRTRYLCIECTTKQKYLVSAEAAVEHKRI